MPHKVRDPITAAAQMLNNFHTIKSRMVSSMENCVFTITQFKSGFTYNVFPDDAFLQGTVRTYNLATRDLIKEKIKLIAHSTAEAFGCEAEVDLEELYPPTVNHAKEADHIKRLAIQWFGEDHFSTDELPLTPSEDFSYFLEKRPGAFFMLGSEIPG